MDSNDAAKLSTKELVEELLTREGVEHQTVSEYSDLCVHINGPAISIIVTD